MTPRPAPPAPPPPPAPAEPSELDLGTNVRVEVTITDQVDGNPPVKKSASVTVAGTSAMSQRFGTYASVRSGVSVPVPTTTMTPSKEGQGASGPMTSYNYRNMGLNVDVNDVVVRGDKVRLRLGVEYNPVDEKTATPVATPASLLSVPSFAAFQQNLTLVLESGKPVVVTQVSDPVPGRDRKASLEVKATILK